MKLNLGVFDVKAARKSKHGPIFEVSSPHKKTFHNNLNLIDFGLPTNLTFIRLQGCHHIRRHVIKLTVLRSTQKSIVKNVRAFPSLPKSLN